MAVPKLVKLVEVRSILLSEPGRVRESPYMWAALEIPSEDNFPGPVLTSPDLRRPS